MHKCHVAQELELTTEKMAFEGRAIARQNRFVIFVEGALPNERVRAILTKRKRNFANARVLEVLTPSPYRETAPCPAFGDCGGCTFQQMRYEAQLQMKRDVLVESLHGIPGVPDIVAPIIGADSPFYFRNKMGFAFGTHHGELVLGLHRRGEWDRVLLTDQCRLQSPESNEIIRRTLAFAREHALPLFDDRRNEGLLRHLVVREGKNTGHRMAHLHTAAPHPALDRFPDCLGDLATTVVLSCHRNVPEAAPADATRVLKGPGHIEEVLNGFRFVIGPSTFFQTNTRQAEKLFTVVSGWASEVKPHTAVDLYAGTGPIALHLSRAAARVVGIESNAESVEMARRNIALNQAPVEMLCAETERTPEAVFPKPTDLVVVDPPRPGLHKGAVDLLLRVAAPNLIYVSCNPATLARDLKRLVEGGYAVEAIQPVDMFPHTFHIEAVARLKRARGQAG